jgi:ribosomal protein L11 methylase PrmA
MEGALPGAADRPADRDPADVATHRAVVDEVVITLDPGYAFGTGFHPTTRLCLVGSMVG